MKKTLFWFAALAVATLGFAGTALADSTTADGEDPAKLFISSPNCAPGSCALFNHHDLNILGRNSLMITFNEAHGDPQWPSLMNPVLLILAMPNVGSTFVPPSLTLSEGTGQAGGGNVFPSNTKKWDSNGFAGFYTASFVPKTGLSSVYSFIGLLNAATSSDNFSNMSSADIEVNSIFAAGFGIVVYELTGTGLQGGTTLTIDFSSPLPVGTFAFSYGCSSLQGGKLGACPGQNTFGTPWTQAGLVVPEPATLLLLGSGLLAAGAIRKKKQRIDA